MRNILPKQWLRSFFDTGGTLEVSGNCVYDKIHCLGYTIKKAAWVTAEPKSAAKLEVGESIFNLHT